PGVARVLGGKERGEIGLDHPRSGELVLLSEADAWFAYSFWLDDNVAPDYARTVAIHHKPGYDPCELFFDPKLTAPKLKAAWRLVQKKLGFRMKMDVIPLDARLVRGSHGLAAAEAQDRPLLIGDGPAPGDDLKMTDVHGILTHALSGYLNGSSLDLRVPLPGPPDASRLPQDRRRRNRRRCTSAQRPRRADCDHRLRQVALHARPGVGPAPGG